MVKHLPSMREVLRSNPSIIIIIITIIVKQMRSEVKGKCWKENKQ
jgi:hypothetical protein